MGRGDDSAGLRGCLSFVRVASAAVFVFAAPITVVGWLSGDGGDLPIWGIWLVLPAFMLAIVVAMFLFNPRGSRPSLFGLNRSEHLEALERDGILIRESFSAVRAFEVDPYDDEGLHYFLELTNGDVLYLTGQALYEFLPIEGDEGDLQPPQMRRFPCTEFELLRHRTEGYLADIVCKGSALEPEIVLPHDKMPEWPRGDWLDVDLIRDVPYAHLKAMSVQTR
ncbi:MAG: hypothetical protein ACOY82_08840 [Pseudomonadota bacterium]